MSQIVHISLNYFLTLNFESLYSSLFFQIILFTEHIPHAKNSECKCVWAYIYIFDTRRFPYDHRRNKPADTSRDGVINNIGVARSEEEAKRKTKKEASRKVARPTFESQVWNIDFLLWQTGFDVRVYLSVFLVKESMLFRNRCSAGCYFKTNHCLRPFPCRF